MADWARMFYDIYSVKKRVMYGEFLPKWRNLTEDEKLRKAQIIADIVKALAKDKDTNEKIDADLLQNWPTISDLEAYGIERPKTSL